MFFIIGINTRNEIIYETNGICPNCGSATHMTFYYSYTCFSFFFIPLFKWNKQYYVKTSCCDALYLISNDEYQQVVNGKELNIDNLTLVYAKSIKYCPVCHHKIEGSSNYCPNCGNKL